MNKEIDINNEEEILKECDFIYFYKSEKCNLELCNIYHDLYVNKDTKFNAEQLFIYLGRIAITLNKQYKKIAELEEQLKNAIVPKFGVGEYVYRIYQYKIEKGIIQSIYIDELGVFYKIILDKTKTGEIYTYMDDEFLFATKEEAEAMVKELIKE